MNKPSNVVLLIDDEPKIRRFLRAGFELDGFSVLEAENGAEALKIATFSPPDLIILDLAMAELLARSEAALRRYFKSATENPVVTAGPLSVDLVSRTVSLSGSRVNLTR